ncbi:MAG: acyltransferase family protein [Clostridia bacterium]|nr:acyltransferase family protein [Clostridia bacterium]
MTSNNTLSRIYYMDVLRIISIVAVITIHITAGEVMAVNHLETESFRWWIANIFNAFSRWGVPIFFMISGALLLKGSEDESAGQFLKKRVLRIGVPFLIWSVIYFFLKHYSLERDNPDIASIFPLFLREMFFDRVYYHFWFIYVLLSVYLVIPFIRRAVKASSDKEILYWLGLWFITTVIYNTVQSFYQYYEVGTYLYSRVFDIPFVMGYSGYFLLGYYLHKHEFSFKGRISLYILGLVSFILIPAGTYFINRGRSTLAEIFYAHFTITTPILAAAVFVLIKNINWAKYLKGRLKLIVGSLSNAVFGVFWIHFIVQIFIVQRMDWVQSVNPLLKTILSILLTFFISYAFVLIIKFNSRLSKYLLG